MGHLALLITRVRLYFSCGYFLSQDEDSLCNKLCTFTMTQKEFMNQHWYHCHTCKMNDGVGVCTVCAKVCHKDHDISYAKYGSFFCDCGAKEDGSCIVSLAYYVNLPLKVILQGWKLNFDSTCHLGK